MVKYGRKRFLNSLLTNYASQLLLYRLRSCISSIHYMFPLELTPPRLFFFILSFNLFRDVSFLSLILNFDHKQGLKNISEFFLHATVQVIQVKKSETEKWVKFKGIRTQFKLVSSLSYPSLRYWGCTVKKKCILWTCLLFSHG